MNLKRIQGTHVLVTGANRGIGQAFTRSLLTRGAERVYAAVRDPANITTLDTSDNRLIPVILDITNSDDIQRVKQTLPRLDLLINNAGTAFPSTYSAASALSSARQEMNTNYFGPLELSTALLELLRQSPNAGIINVSSIAGITNFKALGTYSASKAAAHFLTQGLRAEVGPAGIFVAGVYPGPVDTRMAAGFEMHKPSAHEVAEVVLDAYQAAVEDIFPDAFSRAMADMFFQNPKALEQEFAK
ncbi:SDR family NAD(P)-dependent oxidoreductase [Deinococcus sp. QL22]|uniref:SDR family NAD(P)-dependent oxidoreductase n=1 Tax=Deinococcus sp. QL22 TaxID=2939437 RepID=UPI002017652B|nr:SDR family NAD(P)-dependent oxidoreductase [Deinococcus sp. QL22]UQN08159.1 SDR family NAD(P)-dependent oxidoreductase [Deinococcus sp. QL22]